MKGFGVGKIAAFEAENREFFDLKIRKCEPTTPFFQDSDPEIVEKACQVLVRLSQTFQFCKFPKDILTWKRDSKSFVKFKEILEHK